MVLASLRVFENYLKCRKTLDVVQVQNLAKKAKNPYRCSKISLHKNFKLILEQNVTEQTYLKLNYRWQKC